MVTSESWVSHALGRVRGCFLSTVAMEEVALLCALHFRHRFPEGGMASSPFALQSLVLTPLEVSHEQTSTLVWPCAGEAQPAISYVERTTWREAPEAMQRRANV